MANQLVQYGAVAAGALALPAVAAGVGAAVSRGVFVAGNMEQPLSSFAVGSVADAGTSAFKSTLDSTLTPSALTSVGLGLVGALLSGSSKRPSLTLPNIAATAAVALSVGNLLKQGRAAAEAAASSKGGGTIVNPVNFQTSAAVDVGQRTATKRAIGDTAMYRFPMDSSTTYWMKFSIRPYARSIVNNPYSAGNAHTVITLPLPATIVDAIKLAYQDIGLGIFGGEVTDRINDALNAADNADGNALNKMDAGVKSFAKSMGGLLAKPDIMKAVGRRMLQSMDPAIGAAADIVTGTTPNPHMAVTFQGVNLKNHSFTWRLSPDNLQESKQLESIIRNLQAAALPGFDKPDSKLFLRFPDVVTVDINPSELMEFKPCCITSLVVNYAPNGVPSFFAPEASDNFKPTQSFTTLSKRYPTEIELTVNLRELDIHTNDMDLYKTTRVEQQVAQTSGGESVSAERKQAAINVNVNAGVAAGGQ